MTFNLRIDDITDYKIKKIAEEEQRSKNKQIEYILQEFIKEYENKKGIIKTDNIY